MNLGPPIVRDPAVIGTALVHAGEWRDAKAFDWPPWIKRGVDVHGQARAGTDDEPVSSGDAGGVEEGVQSQPSAVLRRSLFDPERGEDWKFFRAIYPAIDRQSARREAVLALSTHRAKVARAEKRGEVALGIGVKSQAESGKAKIGGKCVVPQPRAAIIEHGRIVGQFLRPPADDLVNSDRESGNRDRDERAPHRSGRPSPPQRARRSRKRIAWYWSQVNRLSSGGRRTAGGR